jgi:hypothetical protein
MGMMMLYFGFWNPDLGFHVWNPKVMGMIMLYFGFWNPIQNTCYGDNS